MCARRFRLPRPLARWLLALPRWLLPAAAALVAARPAASADCPVALGEVLFASPANGTLDVARFPVISVGFAAPIPSDPATLESCVRLLDRTGAEVDLLVRRSPWDDRMAVASPASAAARLDPTTDYVLEVARAGADPFDRHR